MKVLIDTNVIIKREDDVPISVEVAKFFELAESAKISFYVHPASIDDIKRDQNEERRNVILSKIQAYLPLPNPPNPSSDKTFQNIITKSKNENDEVDSKLLYAVYHNAVDYLITEDMGLHKRAKDHQIRDRIITISDAVDIFRKRNPEPISPITPPALHHKYLYEIDLYDPFFDSLRQAYPDFNEWFERKSREHRRSFVYYLENESIGAILIYNEKEEEAIAGNPPLPPKLRCKISTMKSLRTGQKLGELFLKLAIFIAVKGGCKEVYLTHFDEENDYLVALIEKYGFEHVSTLPTSEKVYLKPLFVDVDTAAEYTPIEILNKYYPSYYDGEFVKKWIIPIQPKYHQKLFTDYKSRQSKLSEFEGNFIIEGNTITKAYICRSNVKKIDPGDLVFFYRSEDEKAITTLGVVEDTKRTEDVDEIFRIVAKRTVYSIEELEKWEKPVLIILFRQIFHYDAPIKLDCIGTTAPQSISSLSDESYNQIKKHGNKYGCLAVSKAKIRL